jgi:hypothetical protein
MVAVPLLYVEVKVCHIVTSWEAVTAKAPEMNVWWLRLLKTDEIWSFVCKLVDALDVTAFDELESEPFFIILKIRNLSLV